MGGAGRVGIPGTRWRRRQAALRVFVICTALVMTGLTWDLTWLSIRAEMRASQVDAESYVTNLALAVQWPLSLELQALDRASTRVSRQWNPDTESLDPRRGFTDLRDETSRDVTVLDGLGRVVAATRSARLGASMASHPSFVARRDERGGDLFIVPGAQGKKTAERWQIEVSRRLDGPGGRFAGAVVAIFDPSSLTGMLEQVDIGRLGLIALVPDDGTIRALVSDDAGHVSGVGGSAMVHAAKRIPRGVWTGPSAPDGITRVHAFRRLARRGLTLVVGMDRTVAMRSAIVWATTARSFAAGITLAITAITWLLWRGLAAAQRNAEQAAADHARLEGAYRQAEQAKAEAEDKATQLDCVITGMSDGVMLLDEQFRLAVWNERYALYTGVPRELLRAGAAMEDLLRAQARGGEFGPLADDARIEAEVATRAERLRAGCFAAVAERVRPTGRSVELRRSALPGGGIVTLYTDVTARHQTETARAEARRIEAEAAEQKASFVAVVSHEIRTPLNAVLGSLALLDQSDLSSSQRRLALAAREAGQALLDLVNDVLDMSRLEAGRLELHPDVVDLRALLSGIEALFRADAAVRGIHFVVQIDPDLPSELRADRGRLRQVLMNLLGNAVKFALPGPVVIRAVRHWDGNGRAMLRLCVCDSGPRLAPEDAAHLFRPFSRLGSTDRAGVPGTGLGLAICARLVRLMDGQVGVDEAAEGGNAFWLNLPLLVAEPREQSSRAIEGVLGVRERSLRRISRARILLVEDIASNAVVTAMLLRRAGHCVDVAQSGAQSLEMVQVRFYDLVFMDLAMPAMSGYEAMRGIRALPGTPGTVPIAALTATTAADDRRRCETAGVDAVLPKPASLSDLVGAIERLSRAPRDRSRRPAAVRASAAWADDDGAGSDEPIDIARLTGLRQALGAARLASLGEQCFAETRQRLPLLLQALARGDAPEAVAGAHALAGMAATYALARLENKFRFVMTTASAGEMAKARSVAERLEEDLTVARAALRAALADEALSA